MLLKDLVQYFSGNTEEATAWKLLKKMETKVVNKIDGHFLKGEFFFLSHFKKRFCPLWQGDMEMGVRWRVGIKFIVRKQKGKYRCSVHILFFSFFHLAP